jgi:glycosyltransferase involved in cell wall biosynthesis
LNILLITNLYPENDKQSGFDMSFALHNFAAEWNKNHKVIVIHPYFPNYRKFFFKFLLFPKIKHAFEIDSVSVYNLKLFRLPRINIIFNLFKVRNTLMSINFQPDLIIAHLLSSYEIAYKLSKFYKCNFVLGVHNSDLNYIKKRKYITPILHSKNIAGRSFYIKNKLEKIFPEHKEKMIVANSGINCSEIENHDFFINKILNWENKEKIVIVTVARLVKRKNIDTVLNALANFSKINFEYIVIGDGKEIKSLQNLTNELKLDTKVRFLGIKTRNEILEILKLTDVFVMVSSPETFGLVYLEAMAKGNIVIGSKNWGIDGIIIDGKNGFLSEAGDVNNLTYIFNNIFTSSLNEKKKILLETERTILDNTIEKAAENYLRAIYK